MIGFLCNREQERVAELNIQKTTKVIIVVVASRVETYEICQTPVQKLLQVKCPYQQGILNTGWSNME